MSRATTVPRFERTTDHARIAANFPELRLAYRAAFGQRDRWSRKRRSRRHLEIEAARDGLGWDLRDWHAALEAQARPLTGKCAGALVYRLELERDKVSEDAWITTRAIVRALKPEEGCRGAIDWRSGSQLGGRARDGGTAILRTLRARGLVHKKRIELTPEGVAWCERRLLPVLSIAAFLAELGWHRRRFGPREPAKVKPPSAQEVAAEIGYKRAQTDPVGKLYHFREGRWLSPGDLAREFPSSMRQALLDVVQGKAIGKRARRTFCDRLHVLAPIYGSYERARLTAYGRSVVRWLGACPHDEVEAGPTYRREVPTHQVDRTSLRLVDTERCAECGCRRVLDLGDRGPWLAEAEWAERMRGAQPCEEG